MLHSNTSAMDLEVPVVLHTAVLCLSRVVGQLHAGSTGLYVPDPGEEDVCLSVSA